MTIPRPGDGFRLAVLLLALASPSAARAQPVAVTTCGQVIEERGYLTGDLDCSGWPDEAVVLRPGALLSLGGFTLTAGGDGVRCERSCKVFGPGAVNAVAYPTEPEDLTYGVRGIGSVRIFGVSLARWVYGVLSHSRVLARDCTFRDGAFGIVGIRAVRVHDSLIANHNSAGVIGNITPPSGGIVTRFTIRGTTFVDNIVDIAAARRPFVRDSSCTTSVDILDPQEGDDDWGVCSG